MNILGVYVDECFNYKESIVSDAITYNSEPGRRDLMLEYRDGRGREIELRIEEPNPTQVMEMLHAFMNPCRQEDATTYPVREGSE